MKTKERQFDNFAVTGGTVSRYENLRYHQWRQSCQIDNILLTASLFQVMSCRRTGEETLPETMINDCQFP